MLLKRNVFKIIRVSADTFIAVKIKRNYTLRFVDCDLCASSGGTLPPPSTPLTTNNHLAVNNKIQLPGISTRLDLNLRTNKYNVVS